MLCMCACVLLQRRESWHVIHCAAHPPFDHRFDQVLQQANYASLALKTEPTSTAEEEGLDDELYESLARAKKAATKVGAGAASETMLAEVARKRRAEQEALDRQQAAEGMGWGGWLCGGFCCVVGCAMRWVFLCGAFTPTPFRDCTPIQCGSTTHMLPHPHPPTLQTTHSTNHPFYNPHLQVLHSTTWQSL